MVREQVPADVDEVERRWSRAAAAVPPLLLSPAWWQRQMLDWATSDPEFRVKLLRFVDVLPTLRSAAAVADHVRQYFGGVRQPISLATGLGAQYPFRPVLSR